MNHIAHVDEQADLHDAGQAEQRCLAVRRIREVWARVGVDDEIPVVRDQRCFTVHAKLAVHPKTSMIARTVVP